MQVSRPFHSGKENSRFICSFLYKLHCMLSETTLFDVGKATCVMLII